MDLGSKFYNWFEDQLLRGIHNGILNSVNEKFDLVQHELMIVIGTRRANRRTVQLISTVIQGLDIPF